ncbi:MAG: hypothetical protein U9O89_07745 [Thermoproteota archaeon]|nr:hypothetical protein [Thermoproteota archaeon]
MGQKTGVKPYYKIFVRLGGLSGHEKAMTETLIVDGDALYAW